VLVLLLLGLGVRLLLALLGTSQQPAAHASNPIGSAQMSWQLTAQHHEALPAKLPKPLRNSFAVLTSCAGCRLPAAGPHLPKMYRVCSSSTPARLNSSLSARGLPLNTAYTSSAGTPAQTGQQQDSSNS
jgi:hypothetical protein